MSNLRILYLTSERRKHEEFYCPGSKDKRNGSNVALTEEGLSHSDSRRSQDLLQCNLFFCSDSLR